MLYILYQSAVFDTVAMLIKSSLHEQGIQSQCVTVPQQSESGSDYYIILGAHDLTCDLPLGANYDIYQFEQVNTPNGDSWFTDQYISLMRNATKIYDYSQQNCKLLKEKYGLEAEYLPLSWNNSLPKMTRQRRLNKENSVLFIGSDNDRRHEIISNLHQHGVSVTEKSTVWRKAKSKILSDHLITLNIHFYPEAVLETTRIIEQLAHGNLIISEFGSDQELDNDFAGSVIFAGKDDFVETVKYWTRNQQKAIEFAENAQNLFYQKPEFNYPVPSSMQRHSQMPVKVEVEPDQLPEPDTEPFQIAHTEQPREQIIKLKMKKTPSINIDPDGLPNVTIITPTRNRAHFVELMLHNWYSINYPADKLEWIVIDDSDNQLALPQIPNLKYIHCDQQMTVAEKRNYGAGLASGQIIIHMDDDDYYYPMSVYSRVKLLIDNPTVECVGCSDYGVYNLIENYSFVMRTSNLAEASMGYYKEFWQKQKFKEHPLGEGHSFTRNRHRCVMSMPFDFNFIAITHNQNITGKLRSATFKNKVNTIYKSFDETTQQLLNKIYRKIRRLPTC